MLREVSCSFSSLGSSELLQCSSPFTSVSQIHSTSSPHPSWVVFAALSFRLAWRKLVVTVESKERHLLNRCNIQGLCAPPAHCSGQHKREKQGMLLEEYQILEWKTEKERESLIITPDPESKADKYILVGSRCTRTLKRCNSFDNSLPYEIKDLALPTFTLCLSPEGSNLQEGDCCLQTAQATAPAHTPASFPSTFGFATQPHFQCYLMLPSAQEK